jgi:hypothetical protein
MEKATAIIQERQRVTLLLQAQRVLALKVQLRQFITLGSLKTTRRFLHRGLYHSSRPFQNPLRCGGCYLNAPLPEALR